MDRFRKGLDDEEKAQWVAVANHTRLDCLDDGNTEEFCDALAVRAANAAMAETWIELAVEGGPGSGNFGHAGVKGQIGGSTASPGGSGLPQKVRLSRHAFQRMAERRKFQSVKSALQTLESKETPPGDWHMTLKRGGKVDGYLAGTDGIVKTVLGAWYKAEKLSGPDMAEMAELWLEIAWQPLT